MRKRLIPTVLAAALLAAAAGTADAQRRYVGYFGTSERAVVGAAPTTYVYRANYVLPASWKTSKPASRVLTRRFGPVGSCRIRVTLTGRAIADAATEAAPTRAARLLPTGILADDGTRGNAAWRVVRERGGQRTVTGLLVKPAPSVRTQPAGARVWLELRAVGLVDQSVECHTGGPRTTADAVGDMLAAARIGGFQPR